VIAGSLVLSLAGGCATVDVGESSVASSQSVDPEPQAQVVKAAYYDSSPAVRDLPAKNLGQSSEVRERPRKWLPGRQGSAGSAAPDPVLQPGSAGVPTGTAGTGFAGIGNVDGVLPPDTTGDVGPNHYVQTVNLSFAVYAKDGTLLTGPVDINSLWAGAGGPCESTNDGDPIVLYDHLADRWLISQFALPAFPFGPFYQCIAVSKTADPTGAYWRYQFLWSNTKMNDYPKFGVWPDGWYMSANQFKQGTLSWGGQGVGVFERSKMLSGQSARLIKFDLQSTDANIGGMLPSDLDGTAPPAGTPNYFAVVDDDAWGYSPDQLQLWEFRTNWTKTRNTQFVKVGTLYPSAFDSNLCGYARNCIPQPGGVNVDTLSDRLMYRLQYRSFGTYATLVANHTVDVDGTDHAGIRWYELRKVGTGAWTIHQEGTFAPDGDHRWMGSIAMDANGKIALGYSVSGLATFPSVRAAGRCPTDPPGTLRDEISLVAGAWYQAHSSGRWGDYSTMSVEEGVGFWFTNEYYAADVPGSSAEWTTWISPFTVDCP
jgi:hypothetical protein